MALINCPECGKEISDKSEKCINCGCPIEKTNTEESGKVVIETIPATKEQILDFKRIFLRVTFFLLICLVSLIVIFFVKRDEAYKEAISAYENKDFEKALELFENCTYKESATYMQKVYVDYAYKLIEEKEFQHADEIIELVEDLSIKEELRKESKYEYAVYSYDLGAFGLTLSLLEEIEDYKDSSEYIENATLMENIQGEWNLAGSHNTLWKSYKVNYASIEVEGWNASLYHCIDGEKNYVKIDSCNLEIKDIGSGTNISKKSIFKTEKAYLQIASKMTGDGYRALEVFCVYDDFLLNLENNQEYSWNHFDNRKYMCFKRMEDGVPKKPRIGMSAKELANSIWGEPIDINKWTFSWGEEEQWCYSDNRYVYLDNGFVTAIHE